MEVSFYISSFSVSPDSQMKFFVFTWFFLSLDLQEKDAGYIVDLQLGLAARPNRPPALKSAVKEGPSKF